MTVASSQSCLYHANQESVTSWNSFTMRTSDGGKLHSCQKSQLASILEAKLVTTDTRSRPETSAIIIDGSALINTLPPCASKTFEEYAAKDVIPLVEAFAAIYRRIDIVFDVYIANSLKAETRSKRGQGASRRVTDKGKLPPVCRRFFLRDNGHKTDLFNFLEDKIVESCQGTVVIVTREKGAVSYQLITLEGIAPCNYEEADSLLFLHARHDVEQSHTSLIIKASDTDVLVIAIMCFKY